MAHDVFISHSSQDKVVADAVCAALEAEKIRCWIAPRDIKTGEKWAESITSALKASRVMLLIFSESSNQSEQVANELTLAVKAKVIVVPFKIEDISPSGTMEYYLSGTHWLDAMNPPTEKHIKHLVQTVKYTLGDKPADFVRLSEEDRSFGTIEPAAERGKKPPANFKKISMIAAGLIVGILLIYGATTMLGNPQADEYPPVESESDAQAGSEISEVDLETYAENFGKDGLFVVYNPADSGEGTLRMALLEAGPGDVIKFESVVFPPDNPTTILIETPLPSIVFGNLTLDASDAGVIIDGVNVKVGAQGDIYALDDHLYGLAIESSDNAIMGLQIINFKGELENQGDAIVIRGHARKNTIGGDRSAGSGPIGEGNLLSGNDVGVNMAGGDVRENRIIGNLIGTDVSGKKPNGNLFGVVIDQGASDNIFGPDNIIAFNLDSAVSISDANTLNNTITQNSIYSNRSLDIYIGNGGNKELSAPQITEVDLESGIVKGTASPGSVIEIFSDNTKGGETFEGSTEADSQGNFIFTAGRTLKGPNITATATDEDGNTSEFSSPVGN